jgi:3-oxoacyl-[acyl-carrier-protein] synthase III
LSKELPCAVITGIGHYLPKRILTNQELEELIKTSNEWIVQRTGIRERHIAGDDESTFTMGLAASYEALAMADLQPKEVDLVLCATVTPEHIFPSTAALVQAAIGAEHAGAFDMEAACAGFIYGLSIAKAYITSGMARNILLVCSETLTRITDWQDRASCILFGDGAAAVVIQADYTDSPYQIGEVYTRSDGSKAHLLNVPAGGSKHPATLETIENRMHYMKMNGSEVFKWAVRCMQEASGEVLHRSGLTVEDIDLVVAHQANGRIIEAVAQRLCVPPNKVYQNVQHYGNTSSASIPLALYEARMDGKLKKGDRLLLTAFGGGFSWGAATMRWGI